MHTWLSDTDYPSTLSLLTELLGDRRPDGWSPGSCGAHVDWYELQAGWLSSTEKATVLIAQGLMVIERHGGPPPAVRSLLPTIFSELDH